MNGARTRTGIDRARMWAWVHRTWARARTWTRIHWSRMDRTWVWTRMNRTGMWARYWRTRMRREPRSTLRRTRRIADRMLIRIVRNRVVSDVPRRNRMHRVHDSTWERMRIRITDRPAVHDHDRWRRKHVHRIKDRIRISARSRPWIFNHDRAVGRSQIVKLEVPSFAVRIGDFRHSVFVKIGNGSEITVVVPNRIADAKAVKALHFARKVLQVDRVRVAVVVSDDRCFIRVDLLNETFHVAVIDHPVVHADRGLIVAGKTLWSGWRSVGLCVSRKTSPFTNEK